MAIINKTGIVDGGLIEAEHITRIIDALTSISTDTIVATGSFQGTLDGTASLANTASYVVTAQTASYVLNSISASYADNSFFNVSSSLAQTALIAQTASFVAWANVSETTTDTFLGTASFATSASRAISSSLALTASYYAGTINDFETNPISVVAATTTNLSAVYSNGTAGVGASLSGSANGTLPAIDGVTITTADNVLIKNQTTQTQNGVYDVVSTGSASTRWILSRSINADETTEFDPQIVIPAQGTQAGLIYAQTTDNPTIGTNNIVYTQTTTNQNVTQVTTGTQTLYNIPWWTGTAKQLSKGTSNLQFDSINSRLRLTGSLTVTQNVTASALLMSANSTAPILKITQTGTGNAVLIEDTTNDLTPFIIDSAGFVGIGTGSVSAPLHIKSGTTPQFIQQGTAVSGSNYIEFRNSANAGTGIVGHTNATDAFGLGTTRNSTAFLFTNNTPRLTIIGNGNVAIGPSAAPPCQLYVSTANSPSNSEIMRVENAAGLGFYAIPQIGANFDYFTLSTTSASAIIGSTGDNFIIGAGNGAAWLFSGSNTSPVDGWMYTNANVGFGLTVPTFRIHLASDSAAKPSTNTWTISSDIRLKENIVEADYDTCYDIVKNLPLKRYTWKLDAYTAEQVKDRSKLGWIAQDVETVFPKAVDTNAFSGSGDFYIDDCKNLNSDQIYAAMYGTIKKLIAENETLKSELQAIKTHLGL